MFNYSNALKKHFYCYDAQLLYYEKNQYLQIVKNKLNRI